MLIFLFCPGLVFVLGVVTCCLASSGSGKRLKSRQSQQQDPTFLINNLLDIDESMPECSAAFRRVQRGERDAHSSYPPDLRGLWVSQE